MKKKTIYIYINGRNLTYGVDALGEGGDEAEPAHTLASEAALDVAHKLSPDRLEGVDAEGRAGPRLGGHVVAGGVVLGEDGKQDVVLREDAQLGRQVRPRFVHVSRLDQIVFGSVLAVAFDRHLFHSHQIPHQVSEWNQSGDAGRGGWGWGG